MRELEFVGVAGGGKHLLLVADDGTEYRVAVDDRLRDAVSPADRDHVQMRLPMEGPLTPRDVQHRLRHGADISELGAEAGMPQERLEAYAAPVLAERAYVAQLARQARVPAGGTLLEAVEHRLAARGVTAEPSWDSWRRPDGRWEVVARYASDLASVSQSDESASWTFDIQLRALEPDDDAARWLTDAPPSDPVIVPSTAVNPDWDQAHPATRAARARAEAEAASQLDKTGEGQGAQETDTADERQRRNPTPRGPGSKPLSRRASRRLAARRRPKEEVPSWDEILFGSGRPESQQPPGGTSTGE